MGWALRFLIKLGDIRNQAASRDPLKILVLGRREKEPSYVQLEQWAPTSYK